MNIKLPKSVLNPYIDKISKRCSFLYGLDYIDLIKNNMNSIAGIELTEELKDHVPMAFNVNKRKIRINKNFYNVDINNWYILFAGEVEADFEHSLIHELLHASSTKGNISGIKVLDRFEQNGLNEGITQMITDDVCGYVENKFLRSYNDIKIAAKIIRSTVGNDVICESYFKDSDILVKKINELSKDKNYYKKICAKINALNILCISLYNSKGKFQADYELYDRKLINMYKDLIINIVIPKLKTLSNSDKEKYITKLILDIESDNKIKNEIKTLLANLVHLNELDLLKEKDKLKSELIDFEKEDNFISLVREENLSKKIYVDRNGKVTYLGIPNRVITSPLQCKIIYIKLFEHRYPNFDHLEAQKYVDEMIKGKKLIINQDNILDRRVIYCGIQSKIKEVGYKLMNEYNEFDNSKSIAPSMITAFMSFIKLEELGRIAKKFGLYKNNKEKKDYNFIVCEKKLLYKVHDRRTIDLALFANVWLQSVTESLDYNEEAFDKEMESIYRIIYHALNETYQNTNNFDVNNVLKFCHTKKSREIAKRLLSSPFKVETVFRFMQITQGESNTKQEFKGESYNHKIVDNYEEKVAIKDTKDILGR